jgi:alkaline phosphatase D
MKKIYLFLLLISCFPVFAEESPIQSGPMLGYSDFFETLIWIQTKKESEVKIQYWIKGNKDEIFETKSIKTRAEHAHIAKFITNKVQPGNVYEYKVIADSKEVAFNYPLEFQTQKLWEWRGDPPNFKFAVTSCFYVNDSIFDRPGKPYGSNYEILKHLFKEKPDFMVWLGDNVYLREPDWNTSTGILYRNTHTRSYKDLQPILASTHHYAIWDDHDFGPNDSDRGFFNKKQTLDAFKLFWGNFTYGINDKPGITSKFTWGDIDVFLLDGRYFKTPNRRKTGERSVYGDEQIQWLIDNLAYSKAPFKIIAVGSPALSPVAKYENLSSYPEEQKKLIDMITKENIPGVLFLSGDRHFFEITKLDREKTYPLYDFTISSLTAGATTKGCEEENNMRLKDACYSNNNFGIFEVKGKRKDRILNFRLINYKGEIVFQKEFSEKELK